jgi:hypothetical protein
MIDKGSRGAGRRKVGVGLKLFIDHCRTKGVNDHLEAGREADAPETLGIKRSSRRLLQSAYVNNDNRVEGELMSQGKYRLNASITGGDR